MRSSDGKVISNPNIPPRGGWSYSIPETGWTVRGKDPRDLLRSARKHYRANAIKIPDHLEAKVTDHLCTLVPCQETEATTLWTVAVRGTESLANIVTTAIARGEDPRVDAALANKRAAICANCPLNTMEKTGGCAPCKGAAAIAEAALRAGVRALARGMNLRTPSDAKLGECKECGCELRLKVHIKSDFLPEKPAGLEARVPPFCWQIKDPA